MASLVDCQLSALCELPHQAMLDSFAEALRHGRHPEVLNIYGNYALNELEDPALALALWREAATLSPSVPQYQVNIAKLLIASGQPSMAEANISALRRMGKLGQNEGVARELEKLSNASAD